LTDGNSRNDLSVRASERLGGTIVEWRLVAGVDATAYRDAHVDYFSPARFWRGGPGLEARHWLRRPIAFGDREGWLDVGYHVEHDNQSALYHSLRAILAYDFGSGVGLGGEWSLTRSPSYNESRASLQLYFKHD
jgi:hypothetical protein